MRRHRLKAKLSADIRDTLGTVTIANFLTTVHPHTSYSTKLPFFNLRHAAAPGLKSCHVVG
jgi:hypothetical protein